MTGYKKYRQLISDPVIGDCFRACMATLLQLPPEILPNDHSPHWWFTWRDFLSQFGLELTTGGSKDAIWCSTPWIASVPSLNYETEYHAILMHMGGKVLHDPSTKKRYKTGIYIGSDIVREGKHLVVADTQKLHRLEEYRKELNGSPFLTQKKV